MSNDQSSQQIPRDIEGGEYECSHCGGGATNLLGEEHIWKCSDVTPNDTLEQLVDQFNNWAHSETMNGNNGKATAYYTAAEKLEELID